MDIDNQSGEDLVYEVTDGGPIGDAARIVLGRIAGHENIFSSGNISVLSNDLGLAGGLSDGASVTVAGVGAFDRNNQAVLSIYRLADLNTSLDDHQISPAGSYRINSNFKIVP